MAIVGVFPSVVLASADMAKPGTTRLGVVNGNDPMKVVVPEFLTLAISQSSPAASTTNTISVTLAVSVELSGQDASVITLSNLQGLQLPVNVSLDAYTGGHGELFCGAFGDSRTGQWDGKAAELVLRLCAGGVIQVALNTQH